MTTPVACLDENLLLQYVEGLLSPMEALAIEEHLTDCAECRYLLSAAGTAARDDGFSVAPTQVRRRSDPTSSGSAQRIGEVLGGTYVIEHFLGRGGMGEVYEASHQRLARRFAIKFITSASDDREAIARMRREALVTSGLSHPNIIQVTDFNYTPSGKPYLVMEYLEGESLAERLHREVFLADLSVVRSIVEQVTSALSAAHLEGIVHRDLTPGNIFLCHSDDEATPRVKVMDFGLSKVVFTSPSRPRLQPEELTRVASIIGTPYYMSPEQAQGRSAEVDQRADIFSFGAILYRMLSGHVPFSGADEDELLRQIISGEPTSSPRWEQVPDALRQIVLQALSKNPTARQPSMAALAADLSAALSHIDELHEQQGGSALARAEQKPLLEAQATTADLLPKQPGGYLPGEAAEGRAPTGPAQPRQRASRDGPGRTAGGSPQRRGGSAPTGLAQPQDEVSGIEPLHQETDEFFADAPSEITRRPPRRQRLALGLVTATASAAAITVALLVALYPDHPPSNSSLIAAPSTGAQPRDRQPRDQQPRDQQPPRSASPPMDMRAGPSGLLPGLALGPDATVPLRRVATTVTPAQRRPRPPSPGPTPRPGIGSLSVQTVSKDGRPLWADVLLDGKEVGQTALTLEGVTEGPHHVQVRRPGYLAAARLVRVLAGKRVRVQFTLRRPPQ